MFNGFHPSTGSFNMTKFVNADPYAWPYNGDLRPQNTVFLIIDMQSDFCGLGGYVDKMGYDLSADCRAPIGPIQNVLAAAREKGVFTSCTRARGHRRDLADLPGEQALAQMPKQIGAGIGDPGPCGKISWCAAKQVGTSFLS